MRISTSDKIQILCILYISIWAISPPLSFGTSYRVVAGAATLMWLCIEAVKRPSTFFRPTPATLCAIFFVLYSAFVGYWVDGAEDVVRNFHIYICLLFLIFHESYRNRDIRQLRIVFWAALLLYPLWLGITLSAYDTMRNVSRLLVRSTGIEQDYAEEGIGGYALIYSILIGIPVLLYLTRHFFSLRLPGMKSYLRWLFKSMVLLTLILGCVVILKAGYSIANILMIGGILITVLVGSQRSFKTLRLSVIVIAIVALFPLVSTQVVEFIETSSRGTMYERKVQDIKKTIILKDSIGTVSDRTERYWRSTNLFLENPILGTLSFRDVGKHSAILDRFARYGLFVGAIFAYAIFYLPIHYIRKLSSNGFGLALAVAFVVVGFSFLNNVFASFGFMLFIFYPVAVTYIENNEISTQPVRRKLSMSGGAMR